MNKRNETAVTRAMRALNQMRRHHGGGRRKVLHECRFCKQEFAAREMRSGRCPARKATATKPAGLPHGSR